MTKDRTMTVYVGDETYVFRNKEIDALLETVGERADSTAEAWRLTELIGDEHL